jgi:hypothetical protein
MLYLGKKLLQKICLHIYLIALKKRSLLLSVKSIELISSKDSVRTLWILICEFAQKESLEKQSRITFYAQIFANFTRTKLMTRLAENRNVAKILFYLDSKIQEKFMNNKESESLGSHLHFSRLFLVKNLMK